MVRVVGRLQVGSWDDKEGKKQWRKEVVVEENHFAESRSSFEGRESGGASSGAPSSAPEGNNEGFYPIEESIEDDDLPF